MIRETGTGAGAFADLASSAFYQVLFSRRDVRGHFIADEVPADVLARVLYAAHHAPSVGLSQPWNFLVVRSREYRQAVHDGFLRAREQEAMQFDGERQAHYRSLKLEGILQAPINLLVTCDQSRGGPAVLGRTRQPATAAYSTVCAVQNLWLAARAEGLGVGWVSIIDESCLREIFQLPQPVIPIAYLCIGYVSEFYREPELALKRWGQRLPLEELIYCDQWQQRGDDALLAAIAGQRNFPQHYSAPPGELPTALPTDRLNTNTEER